MSERVKDIGARHAGRHRIEGVRDSRAAGRPMPEPHRIDSSKLMVKRDFRPKPKRDVLSFVSWSDEDLAALAPKLLRAAAGRPGDLVQGWGTRPFPGTPEKVAAYFVAAGWEKGCAERVAGVNKTEHLTVNSG